MSIKLITHLKLASSVLALLSLAACLALPGSEPAPTSSPVPASPTTTAAARSSETPAIVPSETVIPEDIRSSLLQTHEVVVMVQLNTEATAETAEQIAAGNVPPADVATSVLAISGLVDGAEWIIPFVTPPARLQPQWNVALAIHGHTRELLQSWASGSEDAAQVLQEIQGDLTAISQTVDEVERILVGEYGMDMQSLIEAREEALAGIRGFLESTATPP